MVVFLTEIIVICLIAIGFILLGIEIYLGHKKFYRLVAGNTFGDSNNEVEKHHKGLGILIICIGVFTLTSFWWGPELQKLLG